MDTLARRCARLLALPLLLIALSLAAQQDDPAARGPHPDLEPQETVAAMLLALKKDSPQGIAELYAFSSPGNRQQTGDLQQFAAMILSGFPEMLGHKAARHAPPLIDGDRAMIPVQLVSEDDEMFEYVFLMSRQQIPDCDGCWMCDAVVPPEALMQPGPDGEPSRPGTSPDPA